MLKHVSYRSSSSLSRPCDYSFRGSVTGGATPERVPEHGESSPAGEKEGVVESYGSFRRNACDNVSLTSSLSFSSLAMSGAKWQCSRTSSTFSLSDQSMVPVKIYLRRLRSDMEYKTVSLSLQTTCKELVVLLLSKFRLRHRDPNLFFVLMEVTVRAPSDGAPVRRQLVLEDNARPAELQQCRPKGEANFSIGVRRGGLVRVHDSILMPGSQYKSLMVSHNTTAEGLVQLLLNCHSSKEDPQHYCIHEVCKNTTIDRPLKPGEHPIQTQASWPKETKNLWSFVLRRNISYTLNMKSLLSWRRSIDQSSTDTESDNGDHDTTRASIMSYSSTVSNSSSGSSSSGISSNSSSSTCSSSGVSSNESDSLLSSPTVKSALSISSSNESSSTPVKPPKPIPRTLFPPPKASPQNDEEDSGIVLEEEPLTPSPVVPYKGRSSTLSFGSSSRSSLKFARVRSLSKSSADLKSLGSSSDETQLKSSLDLSLDGLVALKTPMASSTPKHMSENSTPTSGDASQWPTPRKNSPCGCKNCFYI